MPSKSENARESFLYDSGSSVALPDSPTRTIPVSFGEA